MTYNKTTVCQDCGEPYIIKMLNCKCGHDHDTSFKFRKRIDWAIELLQKDISAYMDEQINILRAINSELRLDSTVAVNDRWEEYKTITPNAAEQRLRRNKPDNMIMQCDIIAGEG